VHLYDKNNPPEIGSGNFTLPIIPQSSKESYSFLPVAKRIKSKTSFFYFLFHQFDELFHRKDYPENENSKPDNPDNPGEPVKTHHNS